MHRSPSVARSLCLPLVLGCLLAPGATAQTPCFSNFSFGGGVPFQGTTELAGVGVTLVTTETEPFGPYSFRDNLAQTTASVVFSFDQPISEFHLDVSFVRDDEYLTAFSLGDPSSLSGTLILSAGQVTTSTGDDNGAGRLSWFGIATSVVSLEIGADGSDVWPALAVDRFGFLPAAPQGPGSTYCEPAVPNSTGDPAGIYALGSSQVALNDLVLHACGLPVQQFGYFLVAPQPGLIVGAGGSQGNLCLGAPTGRFNATIPSSGDAGAFSTPVDLGALPLLGSAAPGDTFYFQCWYRDGTGNSNFSNGLEITFQ